MKGKIPRILNLPKITDQRGNLTFIEGMRGGHAHKKLEQFVIAASGSFTVVIDDGRKRRKFFLNRPHYGLYIPRMVWRELEDFSSGSICVVLASEEYDESDYYRSYKAFLKAFRSQK
jgi:dTDP-4-dehydrorhamnose 3,5-epimerase-like enzyme